MTGVSRISVLIGCSLILFFAEADARSVLLDADLMSGYQGANVVRTLANGDEITVELIAKDIEGADGFSAVLNYDEALLSFTDFRSGPGIPGLTGLNIPAGGGAVEVGGASLEGTAGDGTVKLGVVTFTVIASIASSDITVGATSISLNGSEVAVSETSGIALQTSPSEIVLDANAMAGQQGATVIDDVTAGQTVQVELIGSSLAGISGFSATLNYSDGLTFDGFSAGDVIPGMTGLQLPGSGQVEIGGASVSGVAGVASGRLAVARFVVGPAFDGEATVSLAGGKFSGAAGETVLDLTGLVTIQGTAVGTSPDFDGSGLVDFTDFLTFAAGFGKVLGDPDYDPALDLDQDGAVGFGDFLQFAAAFGTSGAAAKAALPVEGIRRSGQAYLTVEHGTDRTDVWLTIEQTVGVRGYGAEVVYDPTALRFASVERAQDSPFNASALPTPLASEREPGRLILADALMGGGTITDGKVVHLVFDRLQDRGSGIVLDVVEVFDQTDVFALTTHEAISTGALDLSQNFPNPFNPETQIAYSTLEEGRVNLTVFSGIGQKIAVLVDENQPAGHYRVIWDGRDTLGKDVASGVYVYRLVATGQQVHRKMVLLR